MQFPINFGHLRPAAIQIFNSKKNHQADHHYYNYDVFANSKIFFPFIQQEAHGFKIQHKHTTQQVIFTLASKLSPQINISRPGLDYENVSDLCEKAGFTQIGILKDHNIDTILLHLELARRHYPKISSMVLNISFPQSRL